MGRVNINRADLQPDGLTMILDQNEYELITWYRELTYDEQNDVRKVVKIRGFSNMQKRENLKGREKLFKIKGIKKA